MYVTIVFGKKFAGSSFDNISSHSVALLSFKAWLFQLLPFSKFVCKNYNYAAIKCLKLVLSNNIHFDMAIAFNIFI